MTAANPKIPATPDWAPFKVIARPFHAPPPRSIKIQDGIGDRLRAAAFAELQAREAFNWAASFYPDAPVALRSQWRGLALAEDKHLRWLLKRMEELGIAVADREVSDHLWVSLIEFSTARDFAHAMANAEDRGRKAGERFHAGMLESDAISAEIFRRIAEEEVEHIRLAQRFFPTEDGQSVPDLRSRRVLLDPGAGSTSPA